MAYIRSTTNPTVYDTDQKKYLDLSGFQTATGQKVGAPSNQTNFGSVQTLSDADFATRVGSSGIVGSSDAIRQQDAQTLLDQQKADIAKEAELKRLTTEKAIQDLKTSLSTATGPVPEKPNLSQDYQDLSGKYGIDSLMAELDTLNQQINDSVNSTNTGLTLEKNRTQPKSVQTGKLQNISEQGLNEYNALTNRKAALTDMIKAKTDIINNIMSLKGQDYTNSLNEYNAKFNQAITIQNQINSYIDRQDQQDQQARDDARANLTVLQNLVQESGKSWDQVDLQTKMNIQAEEARAGLPVGTFASFAKTLPTAKLLSTSTGYDGSGNEIVSFIYADEMGNPGVVRTVKTGAKAQKSGSGSSGVSEYQAKLIENGNTYAALEKASGSDGYVSPQVWARLRKDYAFDKKEFDSQFRDYINPADPKDYVGYEGYGKNFTPPEKQ